MALMRLYKPLVRSQTSPPTQTMPRPPPWKWKMTGTMTSNGRRHSPSAGTQQQHTAATNIHQCHGKRKGCATEGEAAGAQNPMTTRIGKLMELWGIANSYPRTHRLLHWSQEGVEVDCRPRWSRAAVLAAVTRGPHMSALMPEAINLVHEDVAYQVRAGFCQVIPWERLKDNLPEHLKVSLVAVISQIGRRGRIILDLSFLVYTAQGKAKKGWK
eukprot:9338820-Ditylum_brightwellii.AAC.1